MKVYINRQVVQGPYGGGNGFVKAFRKFMPEHPNVEMPHDPTMNVRPDVFLLAGLQGEGPLCVSAEQAIMHKMYFAPDCKIVLRVNENDARKGTKNVDDMLLKVSEHVDGTVFVSKWIQKHFVDKGWACSNQAVIINGVDSDVFKPQPKLNNGKMNIVAHHWSDNFLKGSDIYEKIDEFVGKNPNGYAFTYIGRHRCNFKHTKVIRPTWGTTLGEELGKHDVYVSASRFDPGPNHCIESIACGLPTYVHKDGGGCVEFAGQDHAYDNWDELRALLEHKFRGIPAKNSFVPTMWQTCIAEYYRFLERTCQGNSPSGSINSSNNT